MRPKAILTLLESVNKQILYPTEIIIVDGSTDDETLKVFRDFQFKNLQYYKVEEEERGLTKQRNYGVSKVSGDMEVVCFLDDDIVLTAAYFKNLIETYTSYPNAAGVGGYIINKTKWRFLAPTEKPRYEEYEIDGWVKNLSHRKLLRKKMRLLPKDKPCFMPKSSNGFPVSSLPPNDKTYTVEYFLGGVSSFKKEIVDTIKFSTYFVGYGLYEDLEYCVRVSKRHTLYVNTKATLYHYHEESGRPNKYEYGKMVVRNGWYVWRTKFKNPKLIHRFEWNAIMILMTLIRFSNVFSTSNKKEVLAEASGRLVGLMTLILIKPKISN